MRDIKLEDYFHGYLPREDVGLLLKNPGDCIVRISQASIKIPPKTIVSVCIRPGEQKHFVLEEKLRNGKVTVSIDGNAFYSSLQELLSYHKQMKKPLFSKFPSTVPRSLVKRAHWELLHESVEMKHKLGEGAFGEVWQGRLKYPKMLEGIDVAVKLAKMENLDKEKINEIMREARIMRKFDHQNVVKMYGVAVHKEPLMIVMEFINGGSLDSYLKKNHTEVNEKIDMCLGAARGIEYIHKEKCIHRDLAARNCLFAVVGDQKIVKISDFGLTREGASYTLTTARMLPVRWLAPETLATLRFTQKSDVWSFGILVWEIFSNGEEPYPGMTNRQAKQSIEQGRFNDFRNECPSEVSSFVFEYIWLKHEEKRYNMQQISKHFTKFAENKKVFVKSCYIETYPQKGVSKATQ